MSPEERLKAIEARLLERASERTLSSRDRLFGESPDDAYDWGCDDGEIVGAESLLKEFFPDVVVQKEDE